MYARSVLSNVMAYLSKSALGFIDFILDLECSVIGVSSDLLGIAELEPSSVISVSSDLLSIAELEPFSILCSRFSCLSFS